jgi:hypothetical protein
MITRFALGFFVTLALLFPRGALAGGGNFTLKTSSVDESNGEWHLKVRIDLPRSPSMMHTPMRFTFSKEVVDERAVMAKGADPVHHRMVLDVPAKQIVSMDVDFANASGKVFKSTFFEFDVKRADGFFEAGEYLVTLSGPDGEIGGTQKLTMKGDNPSVYRGAMDFSDNNKQKTQRGPKMEAVSSGLDGGPAETAEGQPAASAAPVAGEVAPVGSGGAMVPSDAYNRTAEEEALKGHPQGCGCVAAGIGGMSPGVGVAMVVGAAVFACRRKRKLDRASL